MTKLRRSRNNVTMNRERLISFLHYGYIPRDGSLCPLKEWLSIDSDEIKAMNDQWEKSSILDFLEMGVEVLKSLVSTTGQGMHIVPLSGGLDSRAILAGLLDSLPREKVHAITCGIPGTWDFEIGIQVAEAAGVDVSVVDLSNLQWSTERLASFANEISAPIALFDAYMYAQVLQEGGREPTYWSGFMGDPLVGSHLRTEPNCSWRKARQIFARENAFASSCSLAPDGYQPESVLPERPLVDTSILSAYEQLDFAVRQWGFIRPQVLLEGYTFRSPFLNPDWVQFGLSMPNEHRRKQRGYKRILREAYPGLFALPVKNNVGLPLDASPFRKYSRLAVELIRRGAKQVGLPCTGVDPRLNYTDIAESIRSGPLCVTVWENLQDLQHRDLVSWIDIEALWSEHQSGKSDHSDALNLLTSLEIHLKAGTFEP